MHIQIGPLMRRRLDATIAELSGEFRGVFSRETVARYVEESFVQLGDRPTIGPNFLPLIIERFARERLSSVAQSWGKVHKALPEVLFVCERNAGRSQMAAALADRLSHGWVAVRSAGSRPDEQIDPVVVEAMGELGVDVTLEFPKPLTDEVVLAADVVVTLGCVTPVRCIPASATRTGRWLTRPGSRWRSCAGSVTSSITRLRADRNAHTPGEAVTSCRSTGSQR
jgi:hypothetical protein